MTNDVAALLAPANSNVLALEYDCQDCGESVLCMVPMPCATERRCLTCSFIAMLPPTRRAAVRERIKAVPGLSTGVDKEVTPWR